MVAGQEREQLLLILNHHVSTKAFKLPLKQKFKTELFEFFTNNETIERESIRSKFSVDIKETKRFRSSCIYPTSYGGIEQTNKSRNIVKISIN